MWNDETFNVLSTLMTWIVAPVAAFVWLNYLKIQNHDTKIAVLETQVSAAQVAHDREISEIRENSRSIMMKLDSIEEALRK